MIEREPTPIPVRRGSVRRRILFISLAGLLLLLLSLRGIASFWTDYLWFDSVGFASVWRTLVFSRVLLVVVASLVAFGLLLANLYLADRLSPRRVMGTGGAEEELLERYQEWVEPRARLIRTIFAGFFGILIGLGAQAKWQHGEQRQPPEDEIDRHSSCDGHVRLAPVRSASR